MRRRGLDVPDARAGSGSRSGRRASAAGSSAAADGSGGCPVPGPIGALVPGPRPPGAGARVVPGLVAADRRRAGRAS